MAKSVVTDGNPGRMQLPARRVIFYYQTFVGLRDLEAAIAHGITHIHVASIHFNAQPDGRPPLIYLNDAPPDAPIFDEPVWAAANALRVARGITILLMVGGAGGAFTTMFADFEACYAQLADLLRRRPFLGGVDLDIEEQVALEDVRALIRRLRADFGPTFVIAMAPLQMELANDAPGMAGFVYKDLYSSPEGVDIDYFNAQCYGCVTADAYDAMVRNGYPAHKVNLGMLSQEMGPDAITTIRVLSGEHGDDFGGVFDWEKCDALPSAAAWARAVVGAMRTPLRRATPPAPPPPPPAPAPTLWSWLSSWRFWPWRRHA